MSEKTKLKTVSVAGFKRIKAIEVDVVENGLTVLGGKNRQGKTSFRDAIAWCLGGDKFKPSSPKNDESEKTEINIILTDGTKVSRRGKSLALSAVDCKGRKLTQTHLKDKVPALALDLAEFMNAKPKEKATILLQCLGIGDELKEADAEIARLEDDRRILGREKVAKEKYAAELPEYKEAPKEPVVVADLLQKQKRLTSENAMNHEKRLEFTHIEDREAALSVEVENLRAILEQKELALMNLRSDVAKKKKEVDAMKDVDVSAVNEQIENAQEVNAQIETNARKAAAKEDAQKLVAQYDALTSDLELARKARVALMDGAKMPLEGLDVNDGNLTYNSKEWDCMSDSERIQVSIAIAQSFAPECGFANIGDIESLDIDTQNELKVWCEDNGFQIIAVRVSTHPEECTFMIEDGEIKS